MPPRTVAEALAPAISGSAGRPSGSADSCLDPGEDESRRAVASRAGTPLASMPPLLLTPPCKPRRRQGARLRPVSGHRECAAPCPRRQERVHRKEARVLVASSASAFSTPQTETSRSRPAGLSGLAAGGDFAPRG